MKICSIYDQSELRYRDISFSIHMMSKYHTIRHDRYTWFYAMDPGTYL